MKSACLLDDNTYATFGTNVYVVRVAAFAAAPLEDVSDKQLPTVELATVAHMTPKTVGDQ